MFAEFRKIPRCGVGSLADSLDGREVSKPQVPAGLLVWTNQGQLVEVNGAMRQVCIQDKLYDGQGGFDSLAQGFASPPDIGLAEAAVQMLSKMSLI
jgi:hypothetical protein